MVEILQQQQRFPLFAPPSHVPEKLGFLIWLLDLRIISLKQTLYKRKLKKPKAVQFVLTDKASATPFATRILSPHSAGNIDIAGKGQRCGG